MSTTYRPLAGASTTLNHGPEFSLAVTPEEWMSDALCAQTDPDLFFPEVGGNTDEAKAICAACDVAAQCLAYALANDERHGIWGGAAPRVRARMKNGTIRRAA